MIIDVTPFLKPFQLDRNEKEKLEYAHIESLLTGPGKLENSIRGFGELIKKSRFDTVHLHTNLAGVLNNINDYHNILEDFRLKPSKDSEIIGLTVVMTTLGAVMFYASFGINFLKDKKAFELWVATVSSLRDIEGYVQCQTAIKEFIGSNVLLDSENKELFEKIIKEI